MEKNIFKILSVFDVAYKQQTKKTPKNKTALKNHLLCADVNSGGFSFSPNNASVASW